MRKLLAVLLAATLTLSGGCWWRSSPKSTTPGTGTGASEPGPSGKGRTQDTLPDR